MEPSREISKKIVELYQNIKDLNNYDEPRSEDIETTKRSLSLAADIFTDIMDYIYELEAKVNDRN